MPKTKDTAIEDKVRDILVDVLIVDETEVTPGANLREELGADSLDVVEIGIKLEEEFGFEIDDEEGDKLKTVSDIVKLVEKRTKQ
jgi:acyl carrier protein